MTTMVASPSSNLGSRGSHPLFGEKGVAWPSHWPFVFFGATLWQSEGDGWASPAPMGVLLVVFGTCEHHCAEHRSLALKSTERLFARSNERFGACRGAKGCLAMAGRLPARCFGKFLDVRPPERPFVRLPQLFGRTAAWRERSLALPSFRTARFGRIGPSGALAQLVPRMSSAMHSQDPSARSRDYST